MFIRPNYIIIPLIAIICGLLGRLFARSYDAWAWYQTLQLPSITPPNHVFPAVWTTIFVLTAFAAILAWNTFERNFQFWGIMALFCLNAFLNVFWTYLFFSQRMIGAALLEAIALELVTVLLLGMVASRSYIVGALLVPYAIWNLFAIYLNYMIWITN